MPLTTEMTNLADKLFAREMERIAGEIAKERQNVIADAAKRNILRSGIYLGNRLRVEERWLRRLCEARAESYLTVLKEAGTPLADVDIAAITAAVTELANRSAEQLADQMEHVVQEAGAPVGGEWARGNLQRTADSIAATIHRNLVIEKGLQGLRQKATKEAKIGNEAFVIMSFSPDLDGVYEKAILPTITECGLEPYRVDREEFEGTITEAILEKIQTCRIAVADLRYERPNCYYELGYAVASGKPCIITAREDHDPRRPYRKPNDPEVHFDLDSHKITFWRIDNLSELRDELLQRVRKVLE